MKNRHTLRTYLLGFFTALLLVSFASPALAAMAQKTIQVATGVRIFIDDMELHPTDSAGNPIEAFVYNGTTYLPVRAIGEAFGKTVQWEGSTQSVYVGKHSSTTPAAYLSELDYFTVGRNSWRTNQTAGKDNLGNERMHCLYPPNAGGSESITYKLNAQYSRLTAVFFQQYERRDGQREGATLLIYGDGKELWRGSVAPGIDPVNIDIDITGVLELKFEYSDLGWSGNTALGDVALWS